jgi:hypothetical protein
MHGEYVMASGRTGGSLLIGGIATLIAAVGLGLAGVPTYSIGSDGLGTTGGPVVMILAIAFGLVGAGSAILGAGRPPFERRATRNGLRSLAVGFLLFSLGLASMGGMHGSAVDALIIPLFGGWLAIVVGAVAVAASLALTPGLSRAVSGLFLTGFAIAFFGYAEIGPQLALIVVGCGLMLLGGVGLGVLGIRRSSIAVPSTT